MAIVQESHSAGAHSGRSRSSSLLPAHSAVKAAKQAEAFQLLHKPISSPKPSSPAHPTNPNIEHDFSSSSLFFLLPYWSV